MSKQELIDMIAEKADLTKAAAARALDATLDSITDALKDGKKVTLVGFGNFEVKHRNARKGVNPSTGESMNIPAKDVPKFNLTAENIEVSAKIDGEWKKVGELKGNYLRQMRVKFQKVIATDIKVTVLKTENCSVAKIFEIRVY